MDGPRPCLPDELPELIAAANQVFRPSGGDMARDYPLLFSEANAVNLTVVRDAAGIVAHAGLCLRRALLHGVSVAVAAVGAVFTRESMRGRGLGSAVVAGALDQARATGSDLVLVSGDGPLYRRLGFISGPAAHAWACPAPATADPNDRRAPPAAVDTFDLRPAGDADMPLLARIYDAEAVRFVRDAADWRALMRSGVVFAWPGQIWVVTAAGAPAGYLAVTRGTRRRVFELAGDRDALIAAAPQVSDDVVVPAHDEEMERDLRARGWQCRPVTLPAGHQWLQPPPRPLLVPWYGLNYV